jgi:hypothetical protein
LEPSELDSRERYWDNILENQAYFQQSYFNQTTLHPLALLVFIFLAYFVLTTKRENLLLPFIILTCFISAAQRLVIAGLDFTLMRLLIMVVWMRIFAKNEHQRGFAPNPLDNWLLLFIVYSSIAYTLLYGSASALVNRMGDAVDVLGLYFLFRLTIRTRNDLRRVVYWFSSLAVIISIFFIIERLSGRNFFSVFGGVPEITVIREGRLRCQGAFAHPIIAGVFWASLLPLIAAFLFEEKDKEFRVIFTAGLFASLVIVLLSSSSTPVLGVGFGIIGAAVYFLRSYMKWIRFFIVVTLIGLDLVMQAPVWHLLSRINIVGGSTGYHRYFLIDQTVRHFREWWLLGTRSTAHWGHQMFDVTNQYIAVAFNGGLIALLLYLIMIVAAYKNIGRVLRTDSSSKPYISWALGVTLFVHTMSFIAVSYFGQVVFLWYLTLASAASLSPRIQRVRSYFPALEYSI